MSDYITGIDIEHRIRVPQVASLDMNKLRFTNYFLRLSIQLLSRKEATFSGSMVHAMLTYGNQLVVGEQPCFVYVRS